MNGTRLLYMHDNADAMSVVSVVDIPKTSSVADIAGWEEFFFRRVVVSGDITGRPRFEADWLLT